MGGAAPRILMGIITGAHGVRGLVRVKSFAAAPEAIAAYGPLEDEGGERRFALEPVGAVKGVILAKLPGVEDRNAAEKLKGVRLYVKRAALPEPGEEEYYHADLIGLRVWLTDGSELGRVVAVNDYGAGDHLEIACADGRVVAVPFTRAAVPMVDLMEAKIVIDPPEGLFDNRPIEAELSGNREEI